VLCWRWQGNRTFKVLF